MEGGMLVDDVNPPFNSWTGWVILKQFRTSITAMEATPTLCFLIFDN
jgi:hypothetical protein